VAALSELLRSFDRADRTLLLVLDEAQVLASPVHSDLAHSLRAGLDIRKQTIKVVFRVPRSMTRLPVSDWGRSWVWARRLRWTHRKMRCVVYRRTSWW